ncbi:TIM barrel protein [Treponema sp. TIM-1]|uniref:TIM barrel protein n=1 Tax=Treponema sp. TIM-1 TaxID=2898417 RepID=UPI00397EE427
MEYLRGSKKSGERQKKQYAILEDSFAEKGIDLEKVKGILKNQVVELPSWAVGNSGTRYGTFMDKGAAVTIWDKVDDCAEIQRCLGITPVMASHVLWDKTDDGRFEPVREYAAKKGMRIGTVHPNTFSGQQFRFGSICSPIASVRENTKAHFGDCIRMAREMGSKCIGMWVADGTSYPGQDSLAERKHRLFEGLLALYEKLDPDMTLVLEYKPFEPFFYTTDVPDWGTSLMMCQKLGKQAKVLVDLGHHLPCTNIEQIICSLLDEGKLGGFHFNNRRYADDDLILGTVNPLEIFLIFNEIVDATVRGVDTGITYMLDQSHNIENSLEGIIYSVMNIQTAYAKSLLVDRKLLAAARAENDVVLSNMIIMDAFNCDVEPLLGQLRLEMGLSDIDPLRNHRQSGYAQKAAQERKAGILTLGGGA